MTEMVVMVDPPGHGDPGEPDGRGEAPQRGGPHPAVRPDGRQDRQGHRGEEELPSSSPPPLALKCVEVGSLTSRPKPANPFWQAKPSQSGCLILKKNSARRQPGN